MEFTSENILLTGAVLIFTSILISKTGYRFGIPTLLLFLVVGMLFGSDGLGLQFNNASEAQFIGMVALSVILFTGGMDTRFKDIRPVLSQGILLSTVGVLLTTLLTGLFIFYISDHTQIPFSLTLFTSMLLAATMSSTDSASVFNLLRSQNMNLKENLRPMLELESGSNDPVAYMLTLLLIQVVQFFFGSIIGYGLGRFSIWIINKINLLNSSLYPILLLSLVFCTFTITDLLHGNGYLAVYIAGVVVGNARIVNRKEINTFMDGLTWLFQIILFLTLGLLVNPHELLDVAGVALLIGAFMILIARPLSVFLCLLPFPKMSSRAKCFVSWVGLRGAVPIIFATYPVLAQIEGASQIFNIVFFITLLSLLVQGMTISPIARWLHLDLPAEKEGNDFGVEISEETNTRLNEIELTENMLEHGKRLMDMHIPAGTLVILVKRKDQFLIPNGQLELMSGDKLLIIQENAEEQPSPQQL